MWVSQAQHDILHEMIKEVDRFAIESSRITDNRISAWDNRVEMLEERIKVMQNQIEGTGLKMSKRAMISLPLSGRTEEEITADRERAVKALNRLGYEVVNTLYTSEYYSDEAIAKRGVVYKPLCFLAKSLEHMSCCQAVYFCKGWEKARGCKIEHDAAVAYGVEIIEE